MNETSRKLVDLAAHLFVGILLATILIAFVTLGMGADRVYWPRFFASLITAIAILVVATILLRAEQSHSENPVAVSLFTFANSASALVPMLSEILASGYFELSPNLRESVLFEIFSSAGWPTWSSFVFFSLLVATATVGLWHAAKKISYGEDVAWIASSASVMILSLQSVLLAPWNSSETINHSLLMLLFLVLLAACFSSVLLLALREVPTLARSSAMFVGTTTLGILTGAGKISYAFVKRALVLSFYWLAPLIVFWELLMPVGFRAVELIYSVFTSERMELVFLSFFKIFLKGIILSLLALLLAAFLGWLVALPERIRAAESAYTWIKSLVLRLCVILVSLALIVSISIGLFRLGKSAIDHWFSLPPDSKQDGPVDTPPSAGPDGGSVSTGNGEAGEPNELPPPALRGFSMKKVRLICRNDASGFGWEHGSTDELSLSLSSCSVNPNALSNANGFFLTITSASTEAAVHLYRENRLALNRGQTASDWLATKVIGTQNSIQLYTLNRGMNLIGPVGVPAEFQISRLNRPFSIYKFEAIPVDASYETSDALKEISNYLSSLNYNAEYALCDLYTAERANLGSGELTPVDNWECPTIE